MNKLIKLLALGTVLPLSLNSLNLVSVCYSSESNLSEGAKTGENNELGTGLENTANKYLEDLGVNLETFYAKGKTMGCKYRGGDLTGACNTVAEVFQSGNTSAGVDKTPDNNSIDNSIDKVSQSVLGILIDVVSKGLKWNFSNGVDDMIGALTVYVENNGGEEKLTSQKNYDKYCVGKAYLSAAVVQEMLIKLRDTGSAILNKWEYDECCDNVIKYLSDKSGKELIYKNEEGEKVELYKKVRKMVGATIKETMGEFFSKNYKYDRVVDIKKRLRYKEYFRKCALEGIKGYESTHYNVMYAEKAPTEEYDLSLFTWVDNYIAKEKMLYEKFNELQNLVKASLDDRSKIAELEEHIQKKFDNCHMIQPLSEHNMTIIEISISSKYFSQLKSYAAKGHVVGVNVGDKYSGLNGVAYENLTTEDFGNACESLGKKSTKILKEYHKKLTNKNTQFEQRMNELSASPAVELYTFYHELLSDFLGRELRKLNMYEAVNLMNFYLKGLAILNRFLSATDNEMEWLRGTEIYSLTWESIKDKNSAWIKEDAPRKKRIRQSVITSMNNLNKQRCSVQSKYDKKQYDMLASICRYWRYRQVSELVSKNQCTYGVNIDCRERINDIMPASCLKKSKQLTFKNLPVNLYTMRGFSYCDVLGDSETKVNDKLESVKKNCYNVALSNIRDTIDEIVDKMYELHEENENKPKELLEAYYLYKVLASISSWLVSNGAERTHEKLLSFFQQHDREDKVGDVFKNIVQWSVLYDGLILQNMDELLVARYDWLISSDLMKTARDSLLPIFQTLNGGVVSYSDLYEVYIATLIGENKPVKLSQDYPSVDYDYLVIDNEMEKNRLEPLKSGNKIPEEGWKDWIITPTDSLHSSVKINKLDWQKMGDKLIVLKNQENDEKILMRHKLPKKTGYNNFSYWRNWKKNKKLS